MTGIKKEFFFEKTATGSPANVNFPFSVHFLRDSLRSNTNNIVSGMLDLTFFAGTSMGTAITGYQMDTYKIHLLGSRSGGSGNWSLVEVMLNNKTTNFIDVFSSPSLTLPSSNFEIIDFLYTANFMAPSPAKYRISVFGSGYFYT